MDRRPEAARVDWASLTSEEREEAEGLRCVLDADAEGEGERAIAKRAGSSASERLQRLELSEPELEFESR